MKKTVKTSAIPSVGFISLGCPKALTDSEGALSLLRASGYRIAADFDSADVVVINTCGFIESAQKESLETIAEALAEHGQVIVTGCLGKNAQVIRSAFPEVLAVTGPHAPQEILQAVQRHFPYTPKRGESAIHLPDHGLKLTPRHYAYVKIAEGCDHACRFCIIPQMRGKLVSRPLPEIVREAESLVSHGVQELILIAQDTMAYGMDHSVTKGEPPILTLLEALAKLGVWVRLHYVYPYPFVDRLIEKMAEGKVLPYLDSPLQHASQKILTQMLRPAGPRRQSQSDYSSKLLERIHRWREKVPNLTLRSSFIVGFPGERERDFEDLLHFVATAQFDRLGCFTYSAVEGASANALPNPVEEDVKAERRTRLMKLQEKISRAQLKKRLGQKLRVIVQDINEHAVIARSAHEAPEIDGVIMIPRATIDALHKDINRGDHWEVLITRAQTHDLIAKPIRQLPGFSHPIPPKINRAKSWTITAASQ